MTTKKPTHLVVNRAVSKETREQMEKRAARFGLTSDDSASATTTAPSATRTSTTTKSVDSEQAAKLAARASRFADVKPLPDAKTSKKPTLATTLGAPAKAVTTAVSGADRDLLAKRAARFANVGTK